MWIDERWEDRLQPLRSTIDRTKSTLWTKLPCVVTEVDTSGQHVTVQPTVTGMVKTQNPKTGVWTWQPEQMPLLPMVPVKFPSGGGWTLTFPIKVGDEGTVSFSSRCIDNWWQQGGVQPPLASNGAGSLRMHDLSDGFFELGGRSLPNYLNPVPSTTSVELRDDAGHNVISFDGTNGLSITMPGGFLKLDASGNLRVSGEVYSNYGLSNQNGLSTHTHTQPNDSHGDTEQPTSAPTPGT